MQNDVSTSAVVHVESPAPPTTAENDAKPDPENIKDVSIDEQGDGGQEQEGVDAEMYGSMNPMNFCIQTTERYSINSSRSTHVENDIKPNVEPKQTLAEPPDIPVNSGQASEASDKSTVSTASQNNRKQYWINQLVDVEDDATLDWVDDYSESDPDPLEPTHCIINDNSEIEFAETDLDDNTRILTIEQVHCLEATLLTNYQVESQKFPTIRVPPCYMIKRVLDAIREQMPEITVNSVRIMGGFSSYVMCHKFRYNDLDILFTIDFPLEKRIAVFEKLRHLVLGILSQLAKLFDPELPNQLNLSELAAGYIQKSVVIPLAHEKDIQQEDDCWSLVSLRNHRGRNLEFKFLKSLKRNFEFSTDSFQLILEEDYINGLTRSADLVEPLKQYENQREINNVVNDNDEDEFSQITINHNQKYERLPWLMPQVKVVCLYESFDKALKHLQTFKIEIYNPESLRGGGLLKYCYLRSIGFTDINEDDASRNKSICSMICRFLITCHDPDVQYNRINKYLQTHFPTHYRDRILYLIELRRVAELCTLQNVQLVKNLIDIADQLIEVTETEMKMVPQNNLPPGYQDRRYPQQTLMARHNYPPQRNWGMPVNPMQGFPLPPQRTNFPPHSRFLVPNRHAQHQAYTLSHNHSMNQRFPAPQNGSPGPTRRSTPNRRPDEMNHFRPNPGFHDRNYPIQRNVRAFAGNDVRGNRRDREQYRRRDDFSAQGDLRFGVRNGYVINEGPTHRSRLEERGSWRDEN